MAGKSTLLKNQVLDYLLNGTAIPWIGNADLYISLHSADVGVGGNQTTNELAYGGYLRVAIPLSSLGWSVIADEATNLVEILFPINTSGTPTITHGAIGLLSSGAGGVLWFGALTTPIGPISVGEAPNLPIGSIILTEV